MSTESSLQAIQEFLTPHELWALQLLLAPNSPANRKATKQGTLQQEIRRFELLAAERKLKAEQTQRKLKRFSDRFKD